MGQTWKVAKASCGPRCLHVRHAPLSAARTSRTRPVTTCGCQHSGVRELWATPPPSAYQSAGAGPAVHCLPQPLRSATALQPSPPPATKDESTAAAFVVRRRAYPHTRVSLWPIIGGLQPSPLESATALSCCSHDSAAWVRHEACLDLLWLCPRDVPSQSWFGLLDPCAHQAHQRPRKRAGSEPRQLNRRKLAIRRQKPKRRGRPKSRPHLSCPAQLPPRGLAPPSAARPGLPLCARRHDAGLHAQRAWSLRRLRATPAALRAYR
jgi:hypothetical protein